MARIILEIISSTGMKRELRVFDQAQVSIGRGYGNDLIVLDPYVSASHAEVRLTPEGLVLADLNSLNGVYLLEGRQRSKHKIAGSTPLSTGQVFSIGQTLIQVFLPQHPAAPTRELSAEEKPAVNYIRSRDVWSAVIGFFILYYIDLYLSQPTVKIEQGQIFFYDVVSVLALSIWAGIWALVGRLLRQRGSFQFHLTITCLYVVALHLIMNVGKAVGYISAQPGVEMIINLMAGSTAFGLLLFGHLFYATLMRLRPRVITAVVVPLVFVVIMGIGSFAFMEQFSKEPPHYDRLKPPVLKPFAVHSVDEFINNRDDVFETAREHAKR